MSDVNFDDKKLLPTEINKNSFQKKEEPGDQPTHFEGRKHRTYSTKTCGRSDLSINRYDIGYQRGMSPTLLMRSLNSSGYLRAPRAILAAPCTCHEQSSAGSTTCPPMKTITHAP